MNANEIVGLITAEIMRPGKKQPCDINLNSGSTIQAIVRGLHSTDSGVTIRVIDVSDDSEKVVALADIESVSSNLV